jgi:hypothetical protein
MSVNAARNCVLAALMSVNAARNCVRAAPMNVNAVPKNKSDVRKNEREVQLSMFAK